MKKLTTWFKNTAFHYWGAVIVWPSIKSFLPEVLSKLRELILTFLVSFAVVLYLGNHFQASNFSVDIPTILISLGVTFVFRLCIDIICLPAKIHIEQEKKIQAWVNQYGGDQISTNKIILTPRDDGSKNINSIGEELSVWLSVKNGENQDLRDCRATLKTVKVKKAGKWEDAIERIGGDTKKLLWPAFERDEVIIRQGDDEKVSVASTSHQIIKFIFANHNNRKLDDGKMRDLYIEIVFAAKIGGKSIKDIIFCGHLKYEESKQIGRRLYLVGTKTVDELNK